MAEFLIQNRGHFGRPDLPKRGDIRGFGPNDHTWGLREDKRLWVAAGRNPDLFPPDYGIIRVVALGLPAARKMMRAWYRDAVESDPEFGSDRPLVREHKFSWKINIRDLGPVQRVQFNRDAFTTISREKFIETVEHKALTLSFDENDPDGFGSPRLPGSGSDE